ncbi:hypothetical protein AIIKEEIJ_05957 [Rhodococcus sp. YH1]|nr:hypothetical protein [Rhodococcus sp. YH1]
MIAAEEQVLSRSAIPLWPRPHTPTKMLQWLGHIV